MQILGEKNEKIQSTTLQLKEFIWYSKKTFTFDQTGKKILTFLARLFLVSKLTYIIFSFPHYAGCPNRICNRKHKPQEF
ncbi:hypothetical protein JHK82_055897 [Glycine max]|uniref:Uncharacterized protein n=2 Tax=Glycine subgen. Soja TaxID=1462606 RepID=K7N2E9_SOYBN|nr:hypothetical protein JHK86_055719 [Glycine max]KAG4909872.1 hypothetical protein JHK87_055988 [Glycine soja]KAG4918448.1 hypothetical protein JHK85_056729 [Glycine max]KAG5074530.1 hypothetical protein JHK84_055761 [Glycine max]KAG5077202.1 hypothetical protein JHK82_055897 [Glycine max]